MVPQTLYDGATFREAARTEALMSAGFAHGSSLFRPN
jgi:hypothetical protein